MLRLWLLVWVLAYGSSHTSNWAVLVCTSTFWFNYRHVANVLSIYRLLRQGGMPDDHIILMLADDMACNPRNVFQATVFNDMEHTLNVYGEDIEVDYRGAEVTVENFIRILTNRLPDDTPRSKRLLADEGSNVLIYMSGHGGDNFLKFQDSEEINTNDLADAFAQMREMKRYREILFILDTCQAATMMDAIKSKDILMVSSSVRDESSYAWAIDDALGVHVLDRFTYSLLNFAKDLDPVRRSQVTIFDLIDRMNHRFLSSTPHIREDLFNRSARETLFVDFFDNVQEVHLNVKPLQLNGQQVTIPDRIQTQKQEDEERRSYSIRFDQSTVKYASMGAFFVVAAFLSL